MAIAAASPQDTEPRELWGGAVTCVLPARLKDVSDMRPVPDHQEVWADTGSDQALILEIVEHDPSVSDAECGRHMFEDAAAGNEASTSSIEGIAPLGAQDVPGIPEAQYRCLVRGRQTVPRGRELVEACVLLTVLRLPHVASDLLITLSTPAAAATGAAALGDNEQQQLLAVLLGSLKVSDWGLFGGGRDELVA